MKERKKNRKKERKKGKELRDGERTILQAFNTIFS
jgi:hypothetical protein